ncbi:winged helix-turn-helix transcriptional regulator [Haloplanus sp. GCM10025708]|uniref:winged helix-turn-helix transcriptional regulator n=1 Tax=Haloferacaceae TaxID=1644056 RepID=UPI003610900C
MRNLDETDREILRLLTSDGRRPYSDIADAVDLSAPAVSDRVSRLEEQGIIRQFTVDVDRSKLRDGYPILVDVRVRPDAVGTVRERLADARAVDHVFTTASGRLVVQADAPDPDVRAWLFDVVDEEAVREYDVELLSNVDWSPEVADVEFAMTCVECGKTMTDGGITERVGGDLKTFCCPTCESQYREQYERLERDAE